MAFRNAAILALSAVALATWAPHEASAQVAGGKAKTAKKMTGKVTIFPIQGKAANLAKRLTKVLADESRARGLTVVVAKSSLADTALLVGCDPKAVSCQARVLGQLGSKQAIFGSVEPDRRGSGATVSLTVVRRKTSPANYSFALSDRKLEPAATQLSALLPGLFGEPSAQEPKVAKASTPNEPPEPVRPARAKSPRDAGSGAAAEPTAGTGDALAIGPSASVDSAPSPIDTTSWALIGSGAALVGVGGIFWLAADSKQADIERAPVATAEDLERLEDLESSARTRANLGNLFVAAGFIAAGVGITRVVLRARRGDRAHSSPPDSSIDVAPVPVKGGAALTLTWRH